MEASGFEIGQRAQRVEDERMLRGRGRFTDDIRLADELRLFVLRSPHAFARIVSMDLEAARAAPGVVAVATVEDLKTDGLRTPSIRVRHPDRSGKPMFAPERQALADGAVRFVGDPVVAVFAETEAAARDAAELCEIDYDVCDAVTDAAIARASGAPLVWGEAPGNEAFTVTRGSREAVEAALAKAHRVVSAELRISRVSANPLEPRAALAEWSPGEQKFTLYVGTHTPHAARHVLASEVFGLHPAQLRVVSPDLGGSFGMREGGFPEYVLALWGARRLGRPVRWRSDRSEAMGADWHGRDNISKAELALDADGNFLGLSVRTLANVGAYYSSAGSFVPIAHVGGLAGVYRTPAIFTEVTGVFTNTSPIGAYRGAGRPEATYVIERMIDLAAQETGIDRFELRRRNMIQPDAMPYRTGFVFTYDSGDFPANMSMALEAADWEGFEARRKASATRGLLRGFGLANSIEAAGGGPPDRPLGEDAEIRFHPGGSVTVMLGTKSHGQGHETSFTQLIVDRFGVAPEKVRILTGDTDMLPNGVGTFGSRSMSAGGTVLAAAADRVIAKAKRIAAHMIEADPADIEFEKGEFRVAGTDHAVGLTEVANVAHEHMRLPPGEDLGLSAHASVAPKAATFPAGCHICEVEIDPATGAVRIERHLVVDDAGKVINPALVEAQIHGGAVQGLGQALMEEVRYDEAGQLMSGSFQDYAMPRADDVPLFEVLSNPTPTEANPLGVKGVGEAGTVGAIPAAVNAVLDALAPLGIRHVDMPLTPQRVWQAIRDASA